MSAATNRVWYLAARPDGFPAPSDFDLRTEEVPEPAAGQVLVRNDVMSVDPAMRGRMNDVKSYVAPFQIGAPLEGGAVGTVVASRDPSVKVGDSVLHGLGWREYALLPAAHVRVVDTAAAPASAYLGVLGMPGLTAYAGLLDVARMKPEETVFVSGAAGAVGSIVGQIARLRGARLVIGSAGSASKVEYLTKELGFDAAFNYRDGDIRGQLKRLAPDGIDVYFDNVGGEQLEEALFRMNLHGRIAICGAISQYNTPDAKGIRNLSLLISKRLTMQGFLVLDHWSRKDAFMEEMAQWLRDGKVRADETFVDGIDNAVDGFLGMLKGANTGKMIIRLSS
ncbi:NADP-dependent oxidoreductase [Dactylosporangium matsuzakiense]|uniref:NADP-dependent oxidoreductase n=1 Tax=Dactylosporangium matsuzakiense TaxID=53360 RepID=A0A9W6KJG1_9ACTN|nr:NADP-dependent oxidoreductase [Dactylosporangium matsuzakiense]UWZ46616.1 NADP-dependent oxidoreductase [Dactylosporangium matsuzakiense]GLL01250.1 NADP-dependent oxidoreductase [Dactylosporangium matsuzakiense]